MKRLTTKLTLLIALLTGSHACAADGGYLFVTFKGEHMPLTEQIYFALSPDGRQLAVVIPAIGNLRLLDSHTGAVRWDKKHPRIRLTPTNHFVAFSPSGNLLVTAGQDRGSDLTVWCVATGQAIKRLRGHASFVNGAAFAADGSLRSWSADGTIRVWDLDTGVAKRVISLMPPPEGT